MLVLTRKKDQTLLIGDDIEITVLEIQGEQIRIGINAPKSVKIFRKEIFIEIEEENKNAARINNSSSASMREILSREIPKNDENKPKITFAGNRKTVKNASSINIKNDINLHQ